LSGHTANFYTGCAVVGIEAGLTLEYLDTTTVTFRRLTETEINRYVAREKPFDCAGGFKVEALGITLFDSVESTDPTALIGLPLIWVSNALRQAGYLLP
jgi:septum formation protein